MKIKAAATLSSDERNAKRGRTASVDDSLPATTLVVRKSDRICDLVAERPSKFGSSYM